MLVPKCPHCGSKISIMSFLINKDDGKSGVNKTGLNKSGNTPKVECSNCQAIIRVNPKVIRSLFLLLIPISVVLFLISSFFLIGFWRIAAFLIIGFFAVFLSLILSWRYLEIMEDDNEKNNSVSSPQK